MTPVSPQHSSAHSILQSGKNWPKLARFLDHCSVGLGDNYSNEFERVPASESESRCVAVRFPSNDKGLQSSLSWSIRSYETGDTYGQFR